VLFGAETQDVYLLGLCNLNYIETRAQSRSVMLLYVLGCTRTTLIQPTSFCRFVSAAWSEGTVGNLLSLSRDGD
jgi:hypothetical protein